MPSRTLQLLCAAVCLAAVPAAPRAEVPASTRRVALILFEKGEVPRKLVDGFVEALSVIDVGADSISIIGKRELHRQLGPTYANTAVACGADLRCVAAIGDKADATHVLFGRATADKGGGVTMQWLLVSVKTADIVGKLKTTLAAGGSEAAATQLARDLLGVEAGATAEPVAEKAAPYAPAAASAAEPGPASPASPSKGPAGERSRWSALGVVGSVVFAAGAASVGAGVVSSRDGDGARANLLFAAGEALMLGGVLVWSFDEVRVAPVVSLAPNAGYAGLIATW